MKQPWLDAPPPEAPADDFSPRSDVRGLRAVSAAVAIALLLVLMLRSAELASAVYDLPPWPGTETLITAAEAWHDLMTSLGVAGLADLVRGVKDGLGRAT